MKITKKQLERLDYLFMRWQDEHEYENPEEYRDAVKKWFPGKVKQFTLRPFRVTFRDGASVRLTSKGIFGTSNLRVTA